MTDLFKAFIILLTGVVLFFSGCVKLALRLSPSLIPSFTEAIFEECDPGLSKDAIPANLKILEGLLKNDPGNKRILTALSMGYAGYSMLFIDEYDPERASALFLRARNYGIQALGDKGRVLINPGVSKLDLQDILGSLGDQDFVGLLWATVSQNAWISINLDKPKAIALLNNTEACLKRILQMNPNYLYGLPYILMGSALSARPPMLGGNPQTAKGYFEKAMEISRGKSFLVQYLFAYYYAVRVQDKNLFLKLIDDIAIGEPHDLKDICLINSVIQQKAARLKKKVNELFI